MPPLDPEHKASDRYGLIAVAIGGAIGIDIGRWFSAWWTGLIVGLIVAGFVGTTLLRFEADTRMADGGPTPTRSKRATYVWALFWFALFALPALA